MNWCLICYHHSKMVCCAHHDFNLFFFMLQQAVDKRGSSQCLKIHKKVSFYNKLQSEQRLISNHFLRENSNILKKSWKFVYIQAFILTTFWDIFAYFSNTMTIVTFIKEDLISDSWRNKESSCQNRFCCLMNNLWHHHPSYLIYAIHSRKTLRLRGTSAKHARTA